MSTSDFPDAAAPAHRTPTPPDEAAPGTPVDETVPETPAPVDEAATPAPVDEAAAPVPVGAATLPPAFTGIRPPAWEPSTADAPGFTAQHANGATPLVASGPRIRWAGIVWGLVLAAIAGVALWLLTDPARQAALTTWLVELTPATATAIGALVIGAFALVAGMVGLARRAQRGRERRHAASALTPL